MAETCSENARPWRNEELLKRLYEEEMMSANEISERWGCSMSTVNNWLEKHDSIEKRTRSEAIRNAYGTLNKANFRTKLWGAKKHDRAHEVWWSDGHTVYVHRLLAVAEWGMDAVKDKEVHHKNEIGWDNRPDNLELMTKAEHQSRHRKFNFYKRLRMAELYEHGDLSSRKLADWLDYDVSAATVLEAHKEFYGDRDE